MTIILTIIILSVAFLGESIFGMGGGFISIPLLSILFGVKSGVTLVLIFQLLMGILIFKTYKHTNWKLILPMTISIVIGTVIGTLTLSLVSDIFLRKFLAITILLFLIKMIFFPNVILTKSHEKLWGFFTGAIGGWFQGMTGTSSPIFAMYLTIFSMSKSVMRATLIYVFFTTSVIRIIVSISRGLITKEILLLALPALPFFLFAIYVGHHIHTKISEKYYRYVICCILLFAAITMLLKN